MAGQASGGQQLTPNPNVNAPAGIGGDLWGANGGGITPIGGGINGVTNVKQTLSNGQRETNSNYIPGSTTLAGLSNGAVQCQTADGGPAGPMTADDNTTSYWPADEESPNSADSQL
jgi:hypothetical protein